jgi:hypothetical protein
MKPDNHGRCPMQQVADWLERLGLGQYAQRFADNDIAAAESGPPQYAGAPKFPTGKVTGS